MAGIRKKIGEILVDIRYPATKTGEEIQKVLGKIGQNDIITHTKPLIVDKESWIVKTLNGTYNEIMGKNEEPIAIGGGTYAKELKCGVAFGPSLKDMSLVHVENERASLEYLKTCYKIYKEAIKRLITT